MEYLKIWQDVGAFAKEFLVPVGSAITVIATIVFWVYKKWFKKWYAHYKGNRDQWRSVIKDLMVTVDERLKSIEVQLYPNGGKSINDKVTTICNHMTEIDTMLNDLQTGQRVTREVLDIAYWESDANGKVTYVGGNLCDLLNCNPNQVLGNSWIGLVDKPDRRRIIESWKQSVENASFFKEEFNFLGCDGEKIRVKATARHTKNKDQKLLNSVVRFIPVCETINK